MIQTKNTTSQRSQVSGQVNKKKNKRAPKQLVFGQVDKKRNKRKKNPLYQVCGLARIKLTKRKTKNQ